MSEIQRYSYYESKDGHGHVREWMKTAIMCKSEDVEKLEEEIEQLKVERDEARKECCILNTTYRPNGMIDKHPHDIAKQRGWDCFEEQQPREQGDE